MEGIYDANDKFDFSKLVLTKPTAMTGGNYFIRFSYLENPLYIQPPKSTTKQGILKAGKRHYCDLLFSNENDDFTRWMENLETYCQEKIYEHRAQWFDGEMELHDIENYFTPPLKSYKSGKFYLVRVNISPVLGKPVLKIYDENEQSVEMESIDEKMRVMTILEIQGVKCSAKSFQIEIEMKQMMVLKENNLFEKCLLRGGIAAATNTIKDLEETMIPVSRIQTDREDIVVSETLLQEEEQEGQGEESEKNKQKQEEETIDDVPREQGESITYDLEETDKIIPQEDMQEIEFDLEELPKEDTFQLKQRKEVYYEIYRQAVTKAKLARQMAVSAYLEAKQIKNTYMIEDLDDSDESDLEDEEFVFGGKIEKIQA
jgi:hypothetical protein